MNNRKKSQKNGKFCEIWRFFVIFCTFLKIFLFFCPRRLASVAARERFHFFSRTFCLNFSNARLISISISASETSKPLAKISEMISPLFRIRMFCFSFSGFFANSPTFLDNSLILENVSTIAIVVCVAFWLFRIVASI